VSEFVIVSSGDHSWYRRRRRGRRPGTSPSPTAMACRRCSARRRPRRAHAPGQALRGRRRGAAPHRACRRDGAGA